MVFVIDNLPKFCPGCGTPICDTSIQDFVAKASFHCPHCEVKYQFVPLDKILVVAKETGGDLHLYAGG